MSNHKICFKKLEFWSTVIMILAIVLMTTNIRLSQGATKIAGANLIQDSSSCCHYWAANGNHIYNTNSGNVGIGVKTPVQKLDVRGNTYISGNVGIGTTTPNNLLEVKDLISFKNSGQKTLIGYQAGKYSVALAQYNTYIGYQAGYGSTNTTFKADCNTALGYQALYSDTTGRANNAIGYLALFSNTDGQHNNALGSEALYSNTTGGGNNAIGFHALYSNTTGYGNNALGIFALHRNTEGHGNNAIGENALSLNTTGSDNNALGYYALSGNTTGGFNNALGYYALSENTTGSYNIAIGAYAGTYIADGSGNTTSNHSIYLGNDTKALANGDQNEIVIGYNATGLGSNTVVLGNDSITKTALKGNVGIGTTRPKEKLDVNGNILASNEIKSGGYLQLGANGSYPPPQTDCDSEEEKGRLYIQTNKTNLLFVCTGKSGWTYVELKGSW